MAEGQWLVKVARYGGGESVVAIMGTRSAAEAEAAWWNAQYQSDNYYVEAWDKEKVGDWSWPRYGW